MSTIDDRGKSALERIVNDRIVAYKQQMPTVRQTETFSAWLKDLRDARGRVKILARIQRLEDGNAGDVAPIGDGLSEMRIHFGPGYRVYYVNRGGELILLLCGGDKGSQQRDIEAAKKLAREED
jgi:putative addiction module killer protein